MSNGYPNVTFLTSLVDHIEVKKYINGVHDAEKSPPRPEVSFFAADVS